MEHLNCNECSSEGEYGYGPVSNVGDPYEYSNQKVESGEYGYPGEVNHQGKFEATYDYTSPIDRELDALLLEKGISKSDILELKTDLDKWGESEVKPDFKLNPEITAEDLILIVKRLGIFSKFDINEIIFRVLKDSEIKTEDILNTIRLEISTAITEVENLITNRMKYLNYSYHSMIELDINLYVIKTYRTNWLVKKVVEITNGFDISYASGIDNPTISLSQLPNVIESLVYKNIDLINI